MEAGRIVYFPFPPWNKSRGCHKECVDVWFHICDVRRWMVIPTKVTDRLHRYEYCYDRYFGGG